MRVTADRTNGPRGAGERGAALVEFAISALLLFSILFGIIEFGWAFSQTLDVRHGAREGSRLVAVNYRPDTTHSLEDQAEDIVTEVCARMDGGNGTTVTLRLPSQTGAVPGQSGQRAEIRVTRSLETLTGFFDAFLGGKTLASNVDTRIEVDASWADAYDTEWAIEC